MTMIGLGCFILGGIMFFDRAFLLIGNVKIKIKNLIIIKYKSYVF